MVSSKFSFLQTSDTVIQWWQMWMNSTMIKYRYQMNSFFVVFHLFVFNPKTMCKLIHDQLTCKFKLMDWLKLLTYTGTQINNCDCVFVWDRYFVVHLWKLHQSITVMCLKLTEHWWMFSNVHFTVNKQLFIILNSSPIIKLFDTLFSIVQLMMDNI